MGPEETFHKDKWFGRQLLLYYQVQKMADQFQSLKEFGLSVSISVLPKYCNFRVVDRLE